MLHIWQNPQTYLPRLISFSSVGYFYLIMTFTQVWFSAHALTKAWPLWHSHSQSPRAGGSGHCQLPSHIHLLCAQPNPEHPKPRWRPLQLFSSLGTLEKSSSLVQNNTQHLKSCCQHMPRLFCGHVPQHPSRSLQPWQRASHNVLPSNTCLKSDPSLCHTHLQSLLSQEETSSNLAKSKQDDSNEMPTLETSDSIWITTWHVSSLAGSVLHFIHPAQLTRWFHSCQSWDPMPSIRHILWALSLWTPLIAAVLTLTDRYGPAQWTPQLHRYLFFGKNLVPKACLSLRIKLQNKIKLLLIFRLHWTFSLSAWEANRLGKPILPLALCQIFNLSPSLLSGESRELSAPWSSSDLSA